MSEVLSKSLAVKWALDRPGFRHLRLALWSLLVILAVTLSSGQAEATNRPFTGTTRNELQTILNATTTANGDVIAFSTNNNVTFDNSTSTLEITKTNLTIKGRSATNFGASVESLLPDLLALGQSVKTTPTVNLSAEISAKVNSLAASFPTTNSIIVGSRDVSSTDYTAINGKKIIQTTATSSGLNINNITFKNGLIDYTYPEATNSGGVVNSFIGNKHDITTKIAKFGDFIDNSFVNLTIAVHGYKDTHYLAGGGVIGLRSTENSAAIGKINGNLFQEINITTDRSTSSTVEKGGGAYLEGGGIIGVNAVSSPANKKGSAYLESLYKNLFTKIEIKSADMILGGGLVGVNNNSQNTTSDTYSKLDLVYRNIFGNGVDGDITVQADFSLRGGGVVGVNGLSNAGVELTNLYDNVFGGIKVDVGSYLRGGGVVGAQNNDEEKHQEPDQPTTISEKSVSSKITNVVNNLFYNLEVTAGSGSGQSENKKGEISGGGVLGARTGPNAANIEYLLNNVFKDIKVTSTNGEQLSDTDTKVTGSNILGGGIVGVSSVWWAGISGVANNYFEDIDVTITGGNLTSTPTKGHIKGGGVIGLYSEGKTNTVNDGLALASVLSDNVFKGVKITTQIGGIYGGGLIGASSFLGTKSVSRFTAISKNTFGAADKKIEINTKDLYGGGVIGLYSEKGTSYADFIGSNVFTPGVINVSATNIIGGGLIGATIDKESAGIASIENLLDNGDISSQKVTTTGHLTGGGLIGAVAMGGGDASILNSYSNYFMENVITVGTYLEGGGIIGVRSGGTASIGSIVDNFFVSNKISVGAFIDGGGVIGVTGPPSSSPKLRFGLTEIRDSFFTQNTVTAGGPIAGGLIYSYGLNSPLTIDGSGFLNNTFTSTIANPSQWTGDPTAKVYGTITIDTGLDKKSSANKTNVVILKARANDSIYFNNNKLIDADGERFNSLYFGRVPILTETTTKNFKTEPDYARSDAELRIETEAGGGVILLDPIEVNQDNNNSTYPNRAFYMSVSGPGDFLWGGSNIIRTGSLTPNSTDVNNTIFLNYGSTTNLQLGMTLEAPNHLFRMVPGSNLIVTGKNVMTLQDGSFNGHLQFNLANTTINDPSTVLLTIKPTNPIDISGAVVTLTNFKPGPNLYAGDKFYLIDTGADNMLKGDTYTKTATARQGYFTVYNFIIDKVGSQDVDNGQQLVARLAPKVTPTPEPPLPPVPDPEPTPSPTPAPKPEPVIPPITPPDPTPTPDPNPSPVDPKKPVKPDVPTPQPTPEAPVDKPVTPYIPDTPINTQPEPLEPDKTPYTPTPAEESKIVLEGRVASLAVVTGIGNWLADHSYRSADMAVKENNPLFPPSSGDNTLTGWMPYAGIDAGLFWTHHGSKNKYRTLTFIAGLNRISNSISDNSSFLLSAFFDGGYSSYDVNGNFGTQLSGDGTIRYLGGGLMGRQRWNNGFRLEGSARIGRIRNEFTSSYGQANEADSPPLHYEFETPYLAFHAGLGKEFKVQENALLDVLARYFWTKQDGTSYRFSSGELVEFDSNTSQRVRVGTRYNRFSNPHLSFYIGGAYEYEFSSKVQGHFLGQPFISPDTKGSTGIVDIGVIRSPNQDSNFSIEAGLQGHFGARRGISGGVRLGYEFN